MTTPPPPSSPDTGAQSASLRARLAAKLVDLTLTAIIAFLALFNFAFWTLNLFGDEHYTDAYAYRAAALFVAVLLFEAALIASTARKGTTPGRRLLKIRVVAQSRSRPPSPLRAVVRWAVPLVVAVSLVDAFIRDIPEWANDKHWPALSGRVWWLWVALGWWLLVHASTLWDSQRRGWHDKAAGTIVIKAPRQDEPAKGLPIPQKWQGWRDVPFS